MKEKIQLEQWFNRTFANLERDKDALTGDLENAKKQFPKLMVAYQLLEIYARFLYRKSKAMTRGLRSGRPIPDGDFPPFPIGLPIHEKKDIFQELEEWMAANLEEGARREAEQAEEARFCAVVERELKAASTCVQRYSSQLPKSDKEWDEFRRCISNLERLASEAEALGCN
jgi:hypothetical protein